MAAALVLGTAALGGTLRMEWEREDHWGVRLEGPGLEAHRSVYAYSPHSDLKELFSAMAQNWKGWPGKKTWGSLEGELQLECAPDGQGHVTIRVELETEPSSGSCWRAVGEITVEAGQLDALAKEAAHFLAAEDREPGET